jgi:epoxyqueuosine reductase QueG
MKLNEHPTAKKYFERKAEPIGQTLPEKLDPEWVRKIVMDAGADDVGVASIDNPELAEYRSRILTLFPQAKTCVSVICRMNPYNVRSPYRQQYELEYHHMYEEVDKVARRAVVKMIDRGVLAMNTTSSYPMNMENWPGNGMWWVAHKPVAIAAGKGRMGLSHLVVHPRFGASLALTSILIARELTAYDQPLDYDPCVKCMLCVTTCPVGALNADGHYNSIACCTHSYRDKYGGFTNWVENIVSSKDILSYRRKVSDQETVLMWQGMTVGTSFKCTNCMAVCPGGEDLIGPYVEGQKEFATAVAKPLQDRKETVYVVKGSDADAHVRKRFPHKPVKYVENGVRAPSAAAFLDNLHILFQREASTGLDATFHFRFTGEENFEGTVVIRNKALEAKRALSGAADVSITADSRTWVKVVAKEKNMLGALLTRKIRISGSLARFKAFTRCFPA